MGFHLSPWGGNPLQTGAPSSGDQNPDAPLPQSPGGPQARIQARNGMLHLDVVTVHSLRSGLERGNPAPSRLERCIHFF